MFVLHFYKLIMNDNVLLFHAFHAFINVLEVPCSWAITVSLPQGGAVTFQNKSEKHLLNYNHEGIKTFKKMSLNYT